jgi:hypothetical protein
MLHFVLIKAAEIGIPPSKPAATFAAAKATISLCVLD